MHQEYRHMVQGARSAIIFIHGIIGTPRHFDFLVKLVPGEVAVWNLLLDGHGGDVRAFSRTSMKKWEAQVEAAVEELSSTYEEIHIVAHSMGTLFAIDQAIKNPKVKGLFLLAVPIRLFIKPEMLINAAKVYFDRIKPGDEVAAAAKDCCSIRHSKNIFAYFGWIPRYLELFRKLRHTRKLLPRLGTKSCVYQSYYDEMVSRGTVELLRQNPHIQVTVLEKSGHYYYESTERVLLQKEFSNYIRRRVLWEK